MTVQREMFAEAAPRPTSSSKEVVAAAALAYADTMHKSYDEWSVEEWAEDLAGEYRAHYDGYQFAKNLERRGHCPDAEMVRMLDDFSFEVSEQRDKAVRAWVQAVGFDPAFAVGDSVDLGERYEDRGRIGTIVEIRTDTAEYLVRTDPASTSAYVIAAEAVSAAP